MKKYFLDFETRSAVDIRRFGAYVYANHWSTQVIAASVCQEAGEMFLSWFMNKKTFDLDLSFLLDQEAVIYGHSVFFEYCIYNYCLVRKYGVKPLLDLSKWRCTQAIARTYAMPPKLEAAAVALSLDQTKADERTMLKLSKPRSWDAATGIEWWPVTRDLSKYCDQDTRVSHAIYQRLGDLPLPNASMFGSTQQINHRGIHIDRNLVTRCIDLLETEKAKFVLRGQELGVGNAKSIQQLQARLEHFGLRLPDLQAATVAAALANPETPEPAKDLLRVRQAISRSSTAKFSAMLDLAGADDRVRGLFRYCGAITGRWSSTGVQLQNLPRGDGGYAELRNAVLSDTPGAAMDIARERGQSFNTASVGLIRPSFIPEAGKRFLCSDFGQIETRVLYWLAGMAEELELLRKGLCVYKHMAGKIYSLDDPQAMDKSDARRQVGKVAVLGLGYQMGAERFAKENSMDRVLADKIVDVFRKDRAGNWNAIPKLWFAYERAFRTCLTTKRRTSVGPIGFEYMGDFLQTVLPSGRRISYFMPQVSGDDVLTYYTVESQSKQFIRVQTYGGKLCENIVQATALDLMAAALARLEANEYPIVLTAHDEALAEVSMNFGSLDEMNEIMIEAPSWAAQIPLMAEGWEGDHYHK